MAITTVRGIICDTTATERDAARGEGMGLCAVRPRQHGAKTGTDQTIERMKRMYSGNATSGSGNSGIHFFSCSNER